MLPLITIPLTGCDLCLWRFALIPGEACIECHTCNAKYSVDKLQGVAVRHARAYSITQVHVYCCGRFPTPSANNVGTLARAYGVDCSAGRATPEHPPGEPGFEHEVEREPAVCRWCKGAGEITVNFKTKPCDCVKQENTDRARQEDIDHMYNATFGRFGVKKTFIAHEGINRSPPMVDYTFKGENKC